MKIYCGVFQDGLEIKVAFLKRVGKKLQIQKLISFPSVEHHFILTSNEFNNQSDDINIEMQNLDDSSQPNTNLSEILNYYPIEKTKFVPVITEPQISYLVFEHDSSKRNGDLKNEIRKLWKEATNLEFDPKTIDYIEYKNHSIISSIIQNEIAVLNELKALSLLSESKSLEILPLRSGDISLINYILRVYHPGKDEVFLAVYIGVDSVRLIFIKGGKIVHINRYLGLHFERQGLVGFLSSKIVLEMEYARISEIQHIILTGEVNDDLLSAFKQSFPFVNVSLLNLNVFNLSALSEEDKLKLHSYSLPLVSILDEIYPYREIRKDLDLHSKRLSKISLLQRIDFISIFLFLILSALIFLSATAYLERKEKIEKLKIEKNRIESIKTISPQELAEIESLNKKYEILNAYLNQVEHLLKGQIWWTDELLTIHYFNPRNNKIWLTSISINDQEPNKLIFRGLAIDRSKIPGFMRILRNAELKNIYLYEIRGKKIYQFELTADLEK